MYVVLISSLCFRQAEDLLTYDSSLSIHQYRPAQQLQWNISMKTAEDIEAAKINIDA